MNLSRSMVSILVLCTVAGSWCPGVHGFWPGENWDWDNIKKVLAEATNALQEGARAVARVEEFVDSTLDEECPFTCPRRGEVPIPKENHVPSSNGCGSLELYFDDSPQSWVYLEPGFTSCCHEHDLCYDQCNEDKDLCDLKFKKCLYAVCKSDKKRGLLDEKVCKAKAKGAFMAVLAVGCQLYRDAQANACHCVKRNVHSEL